jgi:hypothetical protein
MYARDLWPRHLVLYTCCSQIAMHSRLTLNELSIFYPNLIHVHSILSLPTRERCTAGSSRLIVSCMCNGNRRGGTRFSSTAIFDCILTSLSLNLWSLELAFVSNTFLWILLVSSRRIIIHIVLIVYQSHSCLILVSRLQGTRNISDFRDGFIDFCRFSLSIQLWKSLRGQSKETFVNSLSDLIRNLFV